jgi:hypothetical protein
VASNVVLVFAKIPIFQASRGGFAMPNHSKSLHHTKVRHELAAASVMVKFARLNLALKRFDHDQPRVPAGQREGGQGVGNSSGSGTLRTNDHVQRVAQSYSMGTFVAQIPRKVGFDCVYKFDFGHVLVPGMTNLGCQRIVPSAGVTHGILLNDNFKGY